MGYAFGSVAFPAAGIGAPHIRDRTYWVGHSGSQGLQKRERVGRISSLSAGTESREASQRAGFRATGGLAYADRERYDGQHALLQRAQSGRVAKDRLEATGAVENGFAGALNGFWRDADWLHCRDGKWRPVEPGT